MTTPYDIYKSLESVLMGLYKTWIPKDDCVIVGLRRNKAERAKITIDKDNNITYESLDKENPGTYTRQVPEKIKDRIEFGFQLVHDMQVVGIDFTDWCIQPRKKSEDALEFCSNASEDELNECENVLIGNPKEL